MNHPALQPSTSPLRINTPRLLRRIAELGEIGRIDGGGVCRLALTDEDRDGRDRVCSWMQELGLAVTIDAILPPPSVRQIPASSYATLASGCNAPTAPSLPSDEPENALANSVVVDPSTELG